MHTNAAQDISQVSPLCGGIVQHDVNAGFRLHTYPIFTYEIDSRRSQGTNNFITRTLGDTGQA